MLRRGEAPTSFVVTEVHAAGSAAEHLKKRAMGIRGEIRRFWQKNF